MVILQLGLSVAEISIQVILALLYLVVVYLGIYLVISILPLVFMAVFLGTMSLCVLRGFFG